LGKNELIPRSAFPISLLDNISIDFTEAAEDLIADCFIHLRNIFIRKFLILENNTIIIL